LGKLTDLLAVFKGILLREGRREEKKEREEKRREKREGIKGMQEGRGP